MRSGLEQSRTRSEEACGEIGREMNFLKEIGVGSENHKEL